MLKVITYSHYHSFIEIACFLLLKPSSCLIMEMGGMSDNILLFKSVKFFCNDYIISSTILNTSLHLYNTISILTDVHNV